MMRHVVQINGGTRDELSLVCPDHYTKEQIVNEATMLFQQETSYAMSMLKRVVVVPGRLVNFVVNYWRDSKDAERYETMNREIGRRK